jgi:ABC-type uncharacterized transport system involved in gliding motility auxiliary subunit
VTSDESLAVLREIRDNQRVQLERQAEALALQREQYEQYKQQVERVDRINARAESMQAFGRRLVMVLVPLLVLLMAMMAWPWVVRLWP